MLQCSFVPGTADLLTGQICDERTDGKLRVPIVQWGTNKTVEKVEITILCGWQTHGRMNRHHYYIPLHMWWGIQKPLTNQLVNNKRLKVTFHSPFNDENNEWNSTFNCQMWHTRLQLNKYCDTHHLFLSPQHCHWICTGLDLTGSWISFFSLLV